MMLGWRFAVGPRPNSNLARVYRNVPANTRQNSAPTARWYLKPGGPIGELSGVGGAFWALLGGTWGMGGGRGKTEVPPSKSPLPQGTRTVTMCLLAAPEETTEQWSISRGTNSVKGHGMCSI